MRKFVMTGMAVGSFAGSYVPVIWGGSVLSMSSILFGAVGGLVGIWAAYKIAKEWF